MQTDILNRRLRFAEKPQPFEQRINIGTADHLRFAAIERHGPLPTPYLFEFVKHVAKNYKMHQRRCTLLLNGSKDKKHPVESFLFRHPHQWASRHARYACNVFDNTQAAKKVLDPTQISLLRRFDHFIHRLMCAVSTASIELSAIREGLTFYSADDIIKHEKCPEATRTSKNPLAVPIAKAKYVVLDYLLGLRWPDAGYRYFAVEIDRNTETTEHRNLEPAQFGQKIVGYVEMFRRELYRTQWGIKNLRVLIITTNEAHRDNIVKFIGKHGGEHTKRFYVKAIDGFGPDWRVPKKVMYGILTEPWHTTNGLAHIDKV